MSQDPYTEDEQRLFERELERKLRNELPSVREEEIKAAAHRAAERELEQLRSELRDELESEVEETTAESPSDLREEANREAPSKLLVGLILLILLLFLLAVSGRLPGLGTRAEEPVANDAGEGLTSILNGPTATPIGFEAVGSMGTVDAQTGQGIPNAGGVAPLDSIPDIDPNIGAPFVDYYRSHDGLRVFGLSISPVLTVNGRQIQWFERTRLEHWPEYAGTPYEVQPGLVGTEYTDGREFPEQVFFTNRPDLRFFPETSHGVGGKFLEYWEAHGGLDVLGYPISDEIVEILPETNQYHTVQYFQRARMELHPEHAGTPDEVQLGLLGRALYLDEARSTPAAVLAPTPVPLP